MAVRGRMWNNHKVQALFAIWANASIQRQLLGAVRNTAVFNKIADELATKGLPARCKAVSVEVEAA